jgi:hypothetical protein
MKGMKDSSVAGFSGSYIKKGMLLFVIIAFSPAVFAQNLKELFISALTPELLPLSTANRLDLCDLYAAGKDARIINAFEEEVSLTRLTDDYLKIQTGNSTTELFLLTLVNESRLIGFIQTVCAPVCDSRLEFYSLSGKKLNAETFVSLDDPSPFIPENADTPAGGITLEELHYDPEKQILARTFNIPFYLNPEAAEEYKWNEIRFCR